jgi:O-antigen/teichoic acid export membrane protein
LENTEVDAIIELRRLVRDLRAASGPTTKLSSVPREREIERASRAALSGMTAAAARAVQVGSSLITVPFTIRYLGTERFGLWMTINSFLAIAGFADFGLGNGLLNSVAKSYGKDDAEGIKRALSSALAFLCIISAIILGVFLSVYRFIPWADFFRVTSPAARFEAGPTLLVFAICFALNLPAGVIQRTQMGLQEGFRTNIWQLVGSVLALVGLFIGIWLQVGLPTLVFAVAGAPLIATALNAIFFFGSRPDLKPRWNLVSKDTTKQIMSVGVLFFALQIVVAIAYSADSLVVARTLGAVNVTAYVIPQRLFSLITTVVAMLVTPLWPAYAEALSRGDTVWVRHALYRSMFFVLIGTTVASLLLLLASHQLIFWWAGPTVNPPLLLLVGLAVWAVMESCGSALAAFLNGSGVLHFQIVTAGVFGISCITAKIYLARHVGIAGLPWATIFTWGLLNFLPLMFYVRWKFRQWPASSAELTAFLM